MGVVRAALRATSRPHLSFPTTTQQAVRELAAAASTQLGLRLYPYSVFHIFFEQYLTIGGEALALLGSGARGAWAGAGRCRVR